MRFLKSRPRSLTRTRSLSYSRLVCRHFDFDDEVKWRSRSKFVELRIARGFAGFDFDTTVPPRFLSFRHPAVWVALATAGPPRARVRVRSRNRRPRNKGGRTAPRPPLVSLNGHASKSPKLVRRLAKICADRSASANARPLNEKAHAGRCAVRQTLHVEFPENYGSHYHCSKIR